MPGPDEAPRQEGQPIHVRVPVEHWHARKLDAFFAHRTQLDHEAYFRREAMPATEDYFVAIGLPMTGEDLYAGIGPD
jgi:hypothetical protein